MKGFLLGWGRLKKLQGHPEQFRVRNPRGSKNLVGGQTGPDRKRWLQYRFVKNTHEEVEKMSVAILAQAFQEKLEQI